MKRHFFQRFGALILALAMVFSLASMAFATESGDGSNILDLDASATSQEDDQPIADESQADESEEDASDDNEEEAPTNTPDSEKNSSTDSADEDAGEGKTTTEDESQETGEGITPIAETALTAQVPSTNTAGWNKNSDGCYYYYYSTNGNTSSSNLTQAKASSEGSYNAFSIPQGTCKNENEEDSETGTTTIPGGIYYFDKDGKLVTDETKLPVSSADITVVYDVTIIDASFKATGTKKQAVKFAKDGDRLKGTVQKGYYLGKDNKVYDCDGNSNSSAAVYTGAGVLGSAPSGSKLKAGTIYNFKSGTPQSETSKTYVGVFDSNGNLYVFYKGKKDGNKYAVGTPYTGAYSLSSVPTKLKKLYAAKKVYYFKNGAVQKVTSNAYGFNPKGTKLYVFTKTSKLSKNHSVGTLFTGKRRATGLPPGSTYKEGYGYSWKKGVGTLFTGVNGKKYWKKGKVKKYKGWIKYNKQLYYFKNSDTCLYNKTVYLKGYGNTKKTYRYTFKSNGQLVTNLFSYKASNYAAKMQIRIDETYRNVIFLLYDSKKKSYDVAALQVICATPARRGKGRGLSFGTYYLSASHRSMWLYNKKQNRYYCYDTHIVTTKKKASGWLFHSPQYKRKNFHTLVTVNYNKFGLKGGHTAGCIRLQVGYCATVYKISQKTKFKRVVIKFNNFKDKGPFGRVTNADVKIPKKQNYDPTTPKSKL